jgi:predicted RNA-binding protein YlqC (UPF0109 family)
VVKDVLEYIVRHLVDDPDAVQVTEVEEGDRVVLRLTVAPEDRGKVIGRHGRTVRAIRDVVRAAGTGSEMMTQVELEE